MENLIGCDAETLFINVSFQFCFDIWCFGSHMPYKICRECANRSERVARVASLAQSALCLMSGLVSGI